jgi:hypothetical protein
MARVDKTGSTLNMLHRQPTKFTCKIACFCRPVKFFGLWATFHPRGRIVGSPGSGGAKSRIPLLKLDSCFCQPAQFRFLLLPSPGRKLRWYQVVWSPQLQPSHASNFLPTPDKRLSFDGDLVSSASWWYQFASSAPITREKLIVLLCLPGLNLAPGCPFPLLLILALTLPEPVYFLSVHIHPSSYGAPRHE